jgi:hypothetical protein
MNSRWSSLSVSLFKGVPCRYAFQVVQIWSRMADYFRGADSAAPSLSRLSLVKEGCSFFHKFDAPRHVSDVIEACSRFLARWMVDRMFPHQRYLLLSSAQAAVVVSAAGNCRPAKSKASLVPAGPLMPHVLLCRFSPASLNATQHLPDVVTSVRLRCINRRPTLGVD